MRIMLRVSIALALLAPGLHAQTLNDVRRLAAAGDTAAAIAAAEAIIREDRRNAEAHFLAGILYLSQAAADGAVSADRRKAEEHFRYATRVGEDSAKYWLALSDLFRSADLMTVRTQVSGLLRRAATIVEASPDDSMVAEVGFRAARLAWERHEHYGKRYAPFDMSRELAIPAVFAEWKYWEEFFERGVRELTVSGDDIAEAEGNLWTVLRSTPGDVRSTGLLLVVLGETYRWAEAVPLARRLVATVPDSGRAWALLGLAYARTDRWPEANAAFDTAFARMTPGELAPYRNIGQIMRRADQLHWDSMPGPAQARLDSLYWRVAQPLALTGTNEVQAEFYARLTYVLHRWSDPWLGFTGDETDIGSVFVRYGPPDIWMVFNRSRIAWVYRDTRFRFEFTLTPGYTRARFAGQSREGLRVAAEESPARFDNIPLYRTLDTILVQVAQFRDRGDTAALAVFGAIPITRVVDAAPIGRLPFATGAIVTDSVGREIQRDRRTETVPDGGADGVIHRSWRLALPPGAYLLRAEAHVPAIDRGARSVEALDVHRFTPGTLELSDVLAASRVAPLDSTASRWTDFFIEPNGGRFLPGASVGLLWEIYDLATDSTGFAHFDVELRFTVEAIERRGFGARIVGGVADAVGLSAQGDDRISLDYTRRVRPDAEGIVTEHLAVELRDAPEGRYSVTVVVLDRITGLQIEQSRTVLVSRDPPARRRDYTSFR